MRFALALTLLLGGDDFADGIRAYHEGRFVDALAAFTAAEHAAGHGASAELLHNRALAALQAGEPRVAEFSAEKAVARGGPEHASLRDFLFGNAAFARGERAAAEAELQEADPTAFVRALLHVEAARRHWQRAATSRSDWPAARRNVERALLRLEELRKKHEEAEKNRQTKKEREPDTPPEDEPDPTDPDSQDPDEQTPAPQQDPDRLSPAQLEELLAWLDAKEAEKRGIRRSRQRARTVGVEKDW